ncbi:MAG: DUF2059 domain-containing protein [Bacteroidia bacterium]|nr:DUF2059 domain-containing protein [Bacteroidia bacterium]
MKRVFVFLLSTVLLMGGVMAQTSSYEKKLSKMMKAQGVEETFNTTVKALIQQFKMINTEVPGEVWDELQVEFEKASIDELISMLVPVYQKHLTEADLDQIIKFYDSPVGKKMAKATPDIQKESMAVGQQWGMKIGEIVAKKLADKGY